MREKGGAGVGMTGDGALAPHTLWPKPNEDSGVSILTGGR